MNTEEDEASSTDLGLKPITVEIDALKDLEKFLTDELTYNMSPKSQEIITDHQSGQAVIGPLGSTALIAVKGEYDVTAAAAIAALGSYVDATRTLIGAIQNVADTYRHADGMVNARMKQVLAAFDDSWAHIQADDKKREEQRIAALKAKLNRIDRVTDDG